MMEKKTTLQQLKENITKEMLSYSLKDWIKLLLLVGVTVLVLSVALLYGIDIITTIDIATDPCGLCQELNPDVRIVTNNIKINWSNITIVPVS